MTSNELIYEAIRLANEVHKLQIDKGDSPYILHPMRVAARLSDVNAQVVAILHDVVEDGNITLEQLAQAFPAEIVAGVDGMTRREGETYEQFIARCNENPLSREVKKSDIQDNLNVTRLGEVSPKDAERLNRYVQALKVLNKC